MRIATPPFHHFFVLDVVVQGCLKHVLQRGVLLLMGFDKFYLLLEQLTCRLQDERQREKGRHHPKDPIVGEVGPAGRRIHAAAPPCTQGSHSAPPSCDSCLQLNRSYRTRFKALTLSYKTRATLICCRGHGTLYARRPVHIWRLLVQ